MPKYIYRIVLALLAITLAGFSGTALVHGSEGLSAAASSCDGSQDTVHACIDVCRQWRREMGAGAVVHDRDPRK